MPGPLGVGEVVLVERDAEFAALVSALDAARAGEGSVVLIEGPAGIGKTALVEVVRERAVQDGFLVLFGRGSEFEREYPFAVARQCLEPLVRRQDQRERLFQGAARLAEPVLLGLPEGADAAPLGILHGLYWVLANLAEGGPVAIVVDDAHWADERSLRFLAYVARRIEASRVALVLTARRHEDAGGVADAALGEIRSETRRGRLELPPLGWQGVAQLLSEIGAQSVDDEFAQACHAATGGNPFLLEELARTLIAANVSFTAVSIKHVAAVAPATVAEAVAATLARLGPHATALARAVAVLGDRAALDLAAAVADIAIADADVAASDLVHAGVLRDERELRFRHPILSGAVAATLSALERAGAHARAAAILRSRGAPPERVALQLLHTAASGDEQVVADLRAAARTASAGGALETATVLLERALAEPPADEALSELLLELGRAELASGRARDALRHLTEAHRQATDPVTRGTAVLLLYTATAGEAAHRGEVADMAEAALAELGDRDAELALRLLGLLALTGRVENVPEPAGDTPAEADFLGRLVLVRMRSDASAAEIGDLALRASRQVDALAVGDSTVVGFSGMFLGLLWADRLDDAERVADRAIAAARRRGAVAFFASAMTVRARARRGAGRLRDAEADARTALDAALDVEWAFARGLAPLLTTLVCQGRADEAARELASAMKGGEIAQAPPMVAVLLARMWVRAARREHAAALADWHEALRWIQPRRPNAGWIEDLAVVAEVQLASGDRDGALATAVESQALADAWGTPSAIGMALHTRARASDGADAIDMLRRAVDLLAESPARFEEAKARVSLGSALRRAGHRVESRKPLREGYALARHCGADGLAERARSELRASGIRLRREAATGADSLTPSERRIAEMAAAGLSNPEIAQELFLTVKTIEMHLTRSYRKLDIRGRPELARALGATV